MGKLRQTCLESWSKLRTYMYVCSRHTHTHLHELVQLYFYVITSSLVWLYMRIFICIIARVSTLTQYRTCRFNDFSVFTCLLLVYVFIDIVMSMWTSLYGCVLYTCT